MSTEFIDLLLIYHSIKSTMILDEQQIGPCENRIKIYRASSLKSSFVRLSDLHSAGPKFSKLNLTCNHAGGRGQAGMYPDSRVRSKKMVPKSIWASKIIEIKNSTATKKCKKCRRHKKSHNSES